MITKIQTHTYYSSSFRGSETKAYSFISWLSKTISSLLICKTISISSVLAENLGTSLCLPEASSIAFSFWLSASKSRSESPAKTRFKKSSPSKPSAEVWCVDEIAMLVRIFLSSAIAKAIFLIIWSCSSGVYSSSRFLNE